MKRFLPVLIPGLLILIVILSMVAAYFYGHSDSKQFGPVNDSLSTAATAEYGQALQPLGDISIELNQDNQGAAASCHLPPADQFCEHGSMFTTDKAFLMQSDGEWLTDLGPGSRWVSHGTPFSDFQIISHPSPTGRATVEIRTWTDPGSVSRPEAMRQVRWIMAAGLAGIARARKQAAIEARNAATWNVVAGR